jgi:hypothetical protein
MAGDDDKNKSADNFELTQDDLLNGTAYLPGGHVIPPLRGNVKDNPLPRTGPSTLQPMGAAPEVSSPAAAPGLPSMSAMPTLQKPTTQASIASGAAQHGVTPDKEALTQFGTGKAAYQAERPLVTAPPETPEYFQQRQAQEDFDRLHPWGSEVSEHPGAGGKLAHVLSRIGNVAGDIVAPGLTAGIPGSDLNNRMQEGRNLRGFGEATRAQEQKQQGEALEAGSNLVPYTDPTSGVTSMIPLKALGQVTAAGVKANASTSNADTRSQSAEDVAKIRANVTKPPTSLQEKQWYQNAGEQLDSGKISDADRTKLAGMQRAEKATGVGSEITSQIGNPPVPADFPKGTKDPSYLAANREWGIKAMNLKNQETAARGAAFQGEKPLAVLDENGDLRYMPARQAEASGAAPAGEGVKAMSRQAQISDIKNASDQVRAALKAGGAANFTPEQTFKLSMAMNEREPTALRDQITALANSGLTPPQRDLVTWLYQLQERALSLRNIAGMGQGSETTRLAILKALPSITSGNVEMATEQLDAFDNMVSNLEKGVAKTSASNPKPAAGAAPAEVPSFADWKKNKKPGS